MTAAYRTTSSLSNATRLWCEAGPRSGPRDWLATRHVPSIPAMTHAKADDTSEDTSLSYGPQSQAYDWRMLLNIL